MNQGLTPCDRRRDSYIAMKVYDAAKKKMGTWAPTNANGYFTGDSMSLRKAFAQSVNSIAVKLGQEVGIPNIINTAHAMGIKSKLDSTPSLALGASDVNLLELVGSYATVVNDGKAHDPVLVTRILDRDGNEVYTAPTEEKQAIPYRSAFMVQQLLQGGLQERGGTSMSLWGYVGKYRDTEFGGKTGTSNNHSDAWFIGVSPKLVCGAWVGGEYRSIHFRTGALGQGSRTALPICGYFYESVLGDPAFAKYHGKFGKPKDDQITPDQYLNCKSVYVPADTDSVAIDSLGMRMEEIEQDITLDEKGNPVVGTKQSEQTESPTDADHKNGNGEATEPKKKTQPQYEDVYF